MNTFTDLVLLIGTNPLPNYVVAEYFLKHNQELKHIWLVHSEEVARQVGTMCTGPSNRIIQKTL